MKRQLLLWVCVVACAAVAQASEKTIRICDDRGCADRPRNSATSDPTHDSNPEETRLLISTQS